MNPKPKKGDFLDLLLRSKKTIFTTKDASLLWGDSNTYAVNVRLSSYVKRGKLLRLRRGLYAKDNNYDMLELATNILRPSYVSFETVLASCGMIFQHYERIFVASYVKREITCDGQAYEFAKMNKTILLNPAGIDQTGEYSIATKERAFLDTLYRSKDYHFDNLSPLDWSKVFDILPIYQNKKMESNVQNYFDDAKRSHS